MSVTHHRDPSSQIAQSFETIIGSEKVYHWEQLDSTIQHQITAALRLDTQIDCVVYPQTPEELSEVVACAYQNRWQMLPCGAGSKLHWGGLADGIRVVVSTARMNRLIEHAAGDLTVTAEAGIRFADLQQTLAQSNQFLAIDPAYPDSATLGGIVATADTGALRQRYGSIRDMLIGISLVRADGDRVKAGGRVVKNVAGYDLMKLFTGSYGTLGIIGQVTFRVYPIPDVSQTVVLTGNSEAIAQATAALLGSALRPTQADLLSASIVRQLELGTGTGLVTRIQNLEISVQKQVDRLVSMAQRLGLQSHLRSADEEASLWKQLREPIESSPTPSSITCKIGVVPSKAVSTLDALLAELPSSAWGIIHAASGLGILHIGDRPIEIQTLLKLRAQCEAHGGFLTVQGAPVSLKQQLDVWGYSGNAMSLMTGIKQQFDSQHLLSPGRFVGGI
ncbi:MAG: FAD-binding oxidoreductase [Elainellaceae cyanobacterium]